MPFARQRGVRVLVVTQPHLSDSHVRQQQALAAVMQSTFGDDPGVRYVSARRAVDLRDRTIAYDGLHLVPAGNAMVAQHLVEPVLELVGWPAVTSGPRRSR